eukprot:TRINITY_DN6180_c0_g1_i1.p3 TRINITY_DN6180_c0_g1~~TRINITY_DN6180_c0_g1_i1.p3  ORF type:complete len:198 (+),score=65.19 TRINITY_DN6180_c0_g1_i1:481-1074(+)
MSKSPKQPMGIALPFPGVPKKGNKPVSKIIFEKWAGEGATNISKQQFKDLVYDYGYFLNDEELETAIKVLDENGDGQIDYQEFLNWWNTENRFEKLKLDDHMLAVVAKASEVFRNFDSNGNGVIDSSEYDAFFGQMQEAGLTSKDKDLVKEDLDKNNDGSISFNEYINYILKSESVPIKTLLTQGLALPAKKPAAAE